MASEWDSFWIQQAFLKNRLLVRVGQLGGLDFFGDQEYGASYVIEPLNYAFGNLFSSTYESFAPAGTPAALIEVIPWRTVYVKSAVLSGNRNPFEQDPNGLHFAIRDTPVFAKVLRTTRRRRPAKRRSMRERDIPLFTNLAQPTTRASLRIRRAIREAETT
jgi:porin